MDPVSTYHDLIEAMLIGSGMTDKMLHVHVGLTIYLGAQIVLRERRAAVEAWLLVLVLELSNELLDRLHLGSWNLPDTATDLAYTMFWPTMILLIGRYRRRRWTVQQQRRSQARALLRPARASGAETVLARR